MRSEMLRHLMKSIAVGLLGLALLPSASAQTSGPEALARTFLEAEAKDWMKSWLDAHPPNTSITGFGGKALFAVELIMAADRYSRADTDKERFHAAADGAAAYVAYSYSATPAVGLVVTAVYLCAQIIESAVAGSYAEAMLEMQKEMILSEKRRQDLIFHYGMSGAYRVIVLAQGLEQMIAEGQKVEEQIRLDCKDRAADYGALANCMDLVTRSIAIRMSTKQAIAYLMLLPDRDLDLLAAKPAPNGTMEEAKPGTQRAILQRALEEIGNTLEQMKAVYDPMASKFSVLAAQFLTQDALNEVSPFVAAEKVQGACLAGHTRLALAASTQRITLAALTSKTAKEKAADSSRQTAFAKLQQNILSLLQEYEQSRLACPEIREDGDLRLLFESLQADIVAAAK